MAVKKDHLPVFEFIILCTVVFMGVCNVSVFYSFHVYMQDLGFSKSISGIVISLYSLSSMIMYGVASSSITVRNTYRLMFVGMGLLILCGLAYIQVTSLWALVLIRVVQGIGVFLFLAPCMTLLVSMISPENSGSAFSLYSTALLLPYSLMPYLSERLSVYIANPSWLYAGTAGLMPLAFLLALFLRYRIGLLKAGADHNLLPSKISTRESYSNLKRVHIFNVLAANGVYFITFSGLFFMFQDYAYSRGIGNAGYFFSMQMGIMIAIRFFGGTVFDRFSKVMLIFTAFIFTSAGFLFLMNLNDESLILPVATIFGIGMGLSSPALNSLMFTVSEPEYRSFNANMMMLTVHLGSFLGPLMGGVMVDLLGYEGFLWIAVLGTAGAAVVFTFVSRQSESVRV
ncbi:MFS transporter [Maridesulfovibrio zosterae]|uniref:MFS transporter n=1 Tax=Maridesulfovibrio zosterae TaxID=82171 RepID=UPI0003F97903|nr:MFS transporter [Maridesulfovibrio zosterae]